MNEPPRIERFVSGLPAPGDDAAVVDGVRSYLRSVREHLRALHDGGADGQLVNETHSDAMDRLVRQLFHMAEESYFESGGETGIELTVMAVGGYARREMSIHSDVDLLFLYRRDLEPYVAAIAERIQYWLWDAQLQLGAATRGIADTVALARQDVSVKTAVLQPRFLAGSGVLFHDFNQHLRAKVYNDPVAFIQERMAALTARHMQYGDSLYLLQPNLKEGAGGLRDYHEAYWATQVTQPTGRRTENFLYLGLLTENEVRELQEALNFLWRVRNELHLIVGRKNDRMSFELQDEIAKRFGFTDGDGSDLPVERLMGRYYHHARAISNYSSLVMEQCRARSQGTPRRRKVRGIEEGLRIADGQLEIPHARQLRENPVLLLTVFEVAQRHDLELTRKARRLVRQNLDLVDDAFRSSREARDVFLRILDSETRVMRTLTAMNEVRLLAAYLPEWEHIVCRWQHVMYHTYTIDVHSIFLVEELRRLWRRKYEQAFPELTDLMLEADDRPVLFLGCLLHDIGKGFGGDHSERGARRAQTCLERLGLEPERVERAVFLVRYHLLMSHVAQRRDLTDPKLILEFARIVGDRTNLRNLYLMTFADVRASSATAWSAWKGQLLRELFERTSEFIETGSDDPGKAIELIERRVEARRGAAAAELRSLGVAETSIQSYFDMMPQRYFTAHTPRQIARHARVMLDLGGDRIMSTAVREMRGNFSEFILCTRDVHGLYANVAGVLTAHGINILGAYVYTTRSGLALEIYRLTTPPGGEDERRITWKNFEVSLEAVLKGEADVAKLVASRGRPVGQRVSPARQPTSVSISNEQSDFYTIVDVVANDRLGLLHDLTRTIAEHGYEIYISKSATILDQVTDAFYLKDRNSKKLHDAEAMERLRVALLEAARGDGEGGGG